MANRMCSILERQEDLRMDGLRNTIEAKGVHALRPQPFQNMLISPDTFRFGTRLNILTATHTGTPIAAIHISLHPDNTNRDNVNSRSEDALHPTTQRPIGTTSDRRGNSVYSEQWGMKSSNYNNHSVDRTAPITNSHGATCNETHSLDTIA